MRTTINTVDRRGGAHSTEEFDKILENARKILADASAYIELHLEELRRLEAGETDPENLKDLRNFVQEAHAAWRQVIDLRVKAGLGPATGPVMDMEQARAEILSRLSRLAA